MDTSKRMKELIEILNKASKAYYQENNEVMSNYEYDALYDELVKLEKQTGITMANSPTINVGYELLSKLPREKHAHPMLSLDKTKSSTQLAEWLGDKEGLMSWKLDGLTIVLTYNDGVLQKAVTRGNGEIGEVVTANAKTFVNIPLKISHKEEVVIRGEAVIPYSIFNKINKEIGETDAKYKNPRNLCSGSVRQLNSEITANREVHFYAFNLVNADGIEFKTRLEQFSWMNNQGFEVVEHVLTNADKAVDDVMLFAKKIPDMDIPSDGLVLTFNDIEYGKSLGRTAKFPRDSIAFKWADETAETVLKTIEWSASRTGLINPVAVFDPVELEGTTVSRASVHNISIVEALELGIGDKITVYKANMIIPQIADNLTRSGFKTLPDKCPVCGGNVEIKILNQAKSLYCVNPLCLAKQIKGLALYVSRDAMNIDGLSEATLEKFVDEGMIHDIIDLYHLDIYKEKIINMDGMGEKSYDNLISSIEKSRNTTRSRFLYSLGIEGIGPATAKIICSYFNNDLDKIMAASQEELIEVEGIGPVTAKAVESFFANSEKRKLCIKLINELYFIEEKRIESNMKGLNFVITGSLNLYANRNALKEEIEKRQGKVTGSVTSKTNYLINNDTTSSSSKNKKAREINVPIISEEEFVKMFNVK